MVHLHRLLICAAMRSCSFCRLFISGLPASFRDPYAYCLLGSMPNHELPWSLSNISIPPKYHVTFFSICAQILGGLEWTGPSMNPAVVCSYHMPYHTKNFCCVVICQLIICLPSSNSFESIQLVRPILTTRLKLFFVLMCYRHSVGFGTLRGTIYMSTCWCFGSHQFWALCLPGGCASRQSR